jgi:PLP dependent protein
MGEIAEKYHALVNHIPARVKLVAVSKTKSPEQILEVYDCGQRIFGESKAQELVSKYEQLPKDIQWHMIGHLQSNKVKYIVPFVNLIHSVDSFKLLKTINKEAHKNNRVVDCLLQMHIAEEETKFGLDIDEVHEILSGEEFRKMEHVRITGLMCMATFTDDTKQIQREFQTLIRYFDEVKNRYYPNDDSFGEKSMGMSDDYQIAINEGSTMIRVGSLIFGHR